MDNFTFDDEYLTRLRAGDRETQSHFYRYFQPRLQMRLGRVVRPQFEAEDLCQRVLFIAFRAFETPGGGPGSGAKLPAWVFGTSRNVLHEWNRWQMSHKQEPFDPDKHDRGSTEDNALQRLLRREIIRAVRQTLTHLQPRDLEIIKKLFFEELDKDQICKDMHVGRDYLRVLLHRALNRFHDEYDDDPPPR